MFGTAHTFTLDGITARPLRVEVLLSAGAPSFTVVGLPEPRTCLIRDRLRAALTNSGFEFPPHQITVNVSPVNMQSSDLYIGLAIAKALLDATHQLPGTRLQAAAVVGQLARDGSVRGVSGALPIAEAAREHGAEAIVVPLASAAQAAIAARIDVIPVDSLRQLRDLCAGSWEPLRPRPISLGINRHPLEPDLADLRGQPYLRAALEIAAGGGHSLMVLGAPGSGRSMAALRLPSILPPLDSTEALEVARIASVHDRLNEASSGRRPFRAPDHTIGVAGLLGRGNPVQAGEATLAHRGVLFLDELAKFPRQTLEALRAPLQRGEVSIAAAGGAHRLPCRFMLLASATPCPCGRGELDEQCACSPRDLQRHRNKLSSALAHRVDLVIGVSTPSSAELAAPRGESSADVRARVCIARAAQQRRLGPGRCNAEMTAAEAQALAIEPRAKRLLADLFAQRRLLVAVRDRTLRLAQTIADLQGREVIDLEEVGLALALARRDRA